MSESGWELVRTTGLKDENANEIYDGYIIAFNLPNGKHGDPHLVFFDEGCFLLAPNGNKNRPATAYVRGSHMEIIGNRFENPELLS
jgi:hypothetical protein